MQNRERKEIREAGHEARNLRRSWVPGDLECHAKEFAWGARECFA